MAEASETSNTAENVFTVLDVEAVPVNDQDSDDASIKTFVLKEPPTMIKIDVAIAGGGMGGIAAALALGSNLRAVITEETSWLGGQLSAQGVSALDENKYVESSGACANYLQMRQAIREAYRRSGNLTAAAAADQLLNPGSCWVTRLAFEPKIALQVIDDMLAPQVQSGTLKIMKRTKIVAVYLHEDSAEIKSLLAVNLDSGKFTEIQCATTIDATELGDLLPLAKIPYNTGSDSRWVTGEAYAPESGNAENVQDFTYPFVLEYHPGQNHVIEKPNDYDDFVQAGKFSLDGYKMFEEYEDDGSHNAAGKPRHLLPFWTYRRLIDKKLFKEGTYQSDLAMINWDSNDLRGKNIIDKSPAVQRQYLALAKRISLGFLYWLQTAAPRDDQASADSPAAQQSNTSLGYPELKLVFDQFGSKDGLSKYPYIREARRLAARLVIVEQDIVEADNPGARARLFPDSCGIGLYPVDIHGFQEIPGAAQPTRPFQIPVAALITDYCANYIAACKNIGVTHITNGAYRLHPIEWGIGTAAGALAKLAHTVRINPRRIVDESYKTIWLQIALAESGAPIFWFDDLLADHPAFVGAQVLAASGLMPVDDKSLSFRPESTLSSTELATITANVTERLPLIKIWDTLVTAIAEKAEYNRGRFATLLLTKLKLLLKDELVPTPEPIKQW